MGGRGRVRPGGVASRLLTQFSGDVRLPKPMSTLFRNLPSKTQPCNDGSTQRLRHSSSQTGERILPRPFSLPPWNTPASEQWLLKRSPRETEQRPYRCGSSRDDRVGSPSLRAYRPFASQPPCTLRSCVPYHRGTQGPGLPCPRIAALGRRYGTPMRSEGKMCDVPGARLLPVYR